MTATTSLAERRVAAGVVELADRLPEDITARVVAAADMHVLVAAVLAAVDTVGPPCPNDMPAWAEPTVRYIVHCAHCGVIWEDPEWETPGLFSAKVLDDPGDYISHGYDEDEWHVEIDGSLGAPYCPKCWHRAWCELCDRPIHVWEEFEEESRPAEAGTLAWHRACKQEHDAAQAVVDTWNARYPVGTPVRYRPLLAGTPTYVDSVTRTPASLLSGAHPVVWIEGKAGCVHLAHVEARPAEATS